MVSSRQTGRSLHTSEEGRDYERLVPTARITLSRLATVEGIELTENGVKGIVRQPSNL